MNDRILSDEHVAKLTEAFRSGRIQQNQEPPTEAEIENLIFWFNEAARVRVLTIAILEGALLVNMIGEEMIFIETPDLSEISPSIEEQIESLLQDKDWDT